MGSDPEIPIPNPTTKQTTNPNTHTHNQNDNVNTNGNISVKTTLSIIQPHSLLPKPTPPATTNNQNDVVPSTFKTFLKQRSNDLSSAISRSITSLKNSIDDLNDEKNKNNNDVTEFNLSGLKVVVMTKNDTSLGKVRISLFSRSNCRDSSAVRRFLRERALRFVEINVDVYTEREKELRERTGSVIVPKIFFNEKLIGGLVELNAMRKNGSVELEKVLLEIANEKFSGDAPAAPVYGFDEVTEEKEDEMVKVVRILRQRLPIQDRLMKIKIVRNCFARGELVELLVSHHGYDYNKVPYLLHLYFAFSGLYFFDNF